MGEAANKVLRPLGQVVYRPFGWWSMMSAMLAALALFAYLSDDVYPRKGGEKDKAERVQRSEAPKAVEAKIEESKKTYRRVLDKGVVYPR